MAAMKETLRSMTGYAAEAADIAGVQVTLELRAVNSRFLDLSFRIVEDFRALEPLLRERITDQVKRGKLEFLRLNARHPLYRLAAPWAAGAPQLWARRSEHRLGQQVLCVTEVFLPTIVALGK